MRTFLPSSSRVLAYFNSHSYFSLARFVHSLIRLRICLLDWFIYAMHEMKNRVIFDFCSNSSKHTTKSKAQHVHTTHSARLLFVFVHSYKSKSCYRHTSTISFSLSVCLCVRVCLFLVECVRVCESVNGAMNRLVLLCVRVFVRSQYRTLKIASFFCPFVCSFFKFATTNLHANTFTLFEMYKIWILVTLGSFLWLCVRVCACILCLLNICARLYIEYNCADAVCTEHTRAVNANNNNNKSSSK